MLIILLSQTLFNQTYYIILQALYFINKTNKIKIKGELNV